MSVSAAGVSSGTGVSSAGVSGAGVAGSAYWQLDVSEYAPSRITATIVAPRPADELTAASRYLWAHSEFDYIVPISVMGGAPPFYFEVSGVVGATIERKSPAFNPGCYSWAVVTIPAATVASWASTQTITVSVYDQENVGPPAATATWTITKNDAKFIFVDAVNGNDAASGTIAAPFQTINGFYLSSLTNNTHANKIAVYRTGTYVLDRWETSSTTGNLAYHGAYKPRGHIAYPGESPVWDFTTVTGSPYEFDLYLFGTLDDWFFGGIDTAGGDYQFIFSQTCNRITFWDVTADAINQPLNVGDNSGFVSTLDVGTTRGYMSMTDVRITNMLNAAGLNNGAAFLLYDVDNFAADGIVITNSQCTDALFPKAAIKRATITGCSVWTGNTGDQLLRLYNAGGGTDKIIQARYCRTYKVDDAASAMTFGEDNGTWGEVFVDRCTHVGGTFLEYPAGGDGYLTESVIVNNRSPVVDADVVQTNVLTYTRIGSVLDADGKLPAGATQYTRGFELRGVG